MFNGVVSKLAMKSRLQLVTPGVAILLVHASSFGQQKWLTDDESRKIAAAAVHAVYPEDCYSTYRKEFLESWVLSERREKLAGANVNRSVYVYEVVADVCEFVAVVDGRPELVSQAHTHESHYGIVAVDRRTGKSYWFDQNNRPAEIFKRLVEDEQLVLDKSHPGLFFSLYLALVLGANEAHEITGTAQLRRLAEENFRSAYSPYERDEKWERKFAAWWRKFRSRLPNLKLETTTEAVPEGVMVRGFSFSGFELTIPRSGPPAQGVPTLIRWNLLLKGDGSVEKRASTTVYAAR